MAKQEYLSHSQTETITQLKQYMVPVTQPNCDTWFLPHSQTGTITKPWKYMIITQPKFNNHKTMAILVAHTTESNWNKHNIKAIHVHSRPSCHSQTGTITNPWQYRVLITQSNWNNHKTMAIHDTYSHKKYMASVKQPKWNNHKTMEIHTYHTVSQTGTVPKPITQSVKLEPSQNHGNT